MAAATSVRHGRTLWLVGLLVAVALAAVLSSYASSQPDGLEKVADEEGFLSSAQDHDLADSPLADYGVRGVDDDRLSVGLAGLAGVAATLAVGGGLLWLVRRRDDGSTTAGPV
ncbi:MAG: PDGLE domain-containing protein [Acidimicrobiales bacterium]